MSATPQVTVLMPVYNAAGFVSDAVRSILDQTFTDFELLIIDDGSTDASWATVSTFTDPRIRLERNEKNLGLIATLNKGIALAHGTYIARMDADDLSLPERLQKQVAFLNQHPEVGVCGSATESFGAIQTTINSYLQTHEQLATLLLFNSCMSHPSVMFRRDLQNLNYDSQYKHAEDYELWTRLLGQTQFANLPDVLLRYRVHAGQITTQQRDAVRDTAARIRRNMLQRLDIEPTETEWMIHSKLGNSEAIRGKEEIVVLEHWLRKLITANKKQQVFPGTFFEMYLGKIWIDACAHAGLGLSASRIAWRSSLTEQLPHTFSDRLKLVVKSIIRN